MGRTEPGGERIFFHALAALVFAAVCAWSAAALYGGFAPRRAAAPAPEDAADAAPGRLRGVLLRREEALPAGAFPGAESGARLSAGETGTESALFFETSDGWEFLRPEDGERLTPERVEALLDAPAQTVETPRLVYGFGLYCVALFDGGAPPAPGPCRISAEGFDTPVRAELTAVTTDALGRTLLRLRLTDFPEALYEMRTIEGEILE